MKIWLTLDPETHRVSVQNRPFEVYDFPPGRRGRGPDGKGWEIRQHKTDAKLYADLLRASVEQDEQDRLHRQWWTDADPKGEPWRPLP